MRDGGEVYRAFAPAVLGYLRAQRVADPEDLLGEVFLQVARDLARFSGDTEALRRWVFTIAHHRLVDDRRRRSRRPEVLAEEIPDQPTVTVGNPSDLPDPELLAALATLTEDQREVVALRFIADLSLKEVARVTRRSTGAVKAIQHRAMEQLGRQLTPQHEER